MTLPPLDTRPPHCPPGPGGLPVLQLRPPGSSRSKSKDDVIQAASQLEETRRALEAATATGDRDLLRSLVSDCAPLERVMEALARAKEALVADPRMVEVSQDGALSDKLDPCITDELGAPIAHAVEDEGLAASPDHPGDELGESIVRTIEEDCLAAVQDLNAEDDFEAPFVRPTEIEDHGIERIEDLNAGEDSLVGPTDQDSGVDLAPTSLG